MTDRTTMSARPAPAAPAAGSARAHRRERVGFTLIELLTVIAIIGILAAILIPTIAACRRQANKSREVSAARQLMVAFQTASDENRGLFVSANDSTKAGGVVNETGETVHAIAAGRWPHRLRPYLGNRFKAALYVNRQGDYYDRTLETQAGFNQDYNLSVGASFGMNGAFVGEVSLNPTMNEKPVRRMEQAALPSRLIAFISSAQRAPDSGLAEDPDRGWWRVRAPSMDSGWPAAEPDFQSNDFSQDMRYGFISYRNGGKAVTAFLDGHIELLTCDTLRDMRLWSDLARRTDNAAHTPGS